MNFPRVFLSSVLPIAMLFVGVAARVSAAAPDSAALQSAQRKFQQIEANAQHPHSSPATTVISEDEVNAYLASGNVRMPAGVNSVHLTGQAGAINATMNVNFDQITASRKSSNPLLGIFSGTHKVEATSHGGGSGGQGTVHIDTVSLDGIEVPQMVLELFVDRYIKPKYPNLGIDNRFQLPDRIDSATVGNHQLTVVQK